MVASSFSAKNGIAPKRSSETGSTPTGLSDGKKVRLISNCLFSFIVFIYLLSQSFPGIYFIDAHYQRYEVTKSIVERFDLSIPEGSEGVQGVDGRTYSLFGLGWSALAVPFYISGKFIGQSPEILVSMLNPLAGAVTVTLVFLFSSALGYTRRSSLAAALFFGLGSMAWPLAKQPFDHVVETLLILSSVYFMYLYVSKRKISCLVASSLSIGIALNTRLTSSLVLPSLLLMMIWEYIPNRHISGAFRGFIKSLNLFIVTLLPHVGLILWYNNYRFGSVFETGYQLVQAKTGLDFFTGTPLLSGLSGFLISPGKGFFYYSPVAIFFFFTIGRFYKRHRGPAICFLIIIVSYLVFLSKNVYWHGDWAWGPRYLLPITPFLFIPIAELLDTKMWLGKKPSLVGLVYFVFTLSFAIQLAAVSVHFCNHFLHLRIDDRNLFSAAKGKGIPSIFEPPNEIYFDWKKSPILHQFRYIYDIGMGIKNYKYVKTQKITEKENKSKKSISVRMYFENPRTLADAEVIRALPPFRIFDFWWVYLYFEKNKSVGFMVLPIFLIIISVYGFQLVILSRRQSN